MKKMDKIIESTNIQIVNVENRLLQLEDWDIDYLNTIKFLHHEIRQLTNSKKDVIRGYQLSELLKVAKYQIIKEPIYFDNMAIANYGYSNYQAELISQYACLSNKQKKLWLNNLKFIMTPELYNLDNKIDRLIDQISFGQNRNLLISGCSGVGKTTYLNWRATREPVQIFEEHNEVPIVIIQCPANAPSSKGIFQRIISRMGKTYYSSDSDEDLFEKAVIYINQCDVKLLILDEISHLKRHSLRRRILELSNETNICIVGSAVHSEEFTFGDLEIQGRFNDVFPFEQYAGENLVALLAIIELLLPFPKPSELYKTEILTETGKCEGPAAFISKVTGGTIRDIMILIHDACLLAINLNEPCVDMNILRRAWKNIKNKEIFGFELE